MLHLVDSSYEKALEYARALKCCLKCPSCHQKPNMVPDSIWCNECYDGAPDAGPQMIVSDDHCRRSWMVAQWNDLVRECYDDNPPRKPLAKLRGRGLRKRKAFLRRHVPLEHIDPGIFVLRIVSYGDWRYARARTARRARQSALENSIRPIRKREYGDTSEGTEF